MDFRQSLRDLFTGDSDYIFDFELFGFSEALYENRQSIPLLYRYMPADYHSIRSLETNTIHLSEIGNMNDVFEGFSACMDSATPEMMHALRDLVYIKSFSEQPNDPLMWAHYAANSSGICVEYDLSEMAKHPEYYYHLFPVCYMADRLKAKQNYRILAKSLERYRYDHQSCDADDLQDLYPFFLTKSEAWSREAEWRFLVSHPQMFEVWEEGGVLSDDEHPFQYAINEQTIDFPYATRVFLGPRIEPEKRKHIIEICKRLGKLRVYDMILSDSEFKLEPIKIEIGNCEE